MGLTSIEWTERTWNPFRGCSPVSPGCANCYAARNAWRFNNGAYDGLVEWNDGNPRWTGKVKVLPEKFNEPSRWRKPSMVFVNSMSDTFHDSVPAADVFALFDAMEEAPQHIFQVLTKRAREMRAMAIAYTKVLRKNELLRPASIPPAPLQNVWLGVTVESNKYPVVYDRGLWLLRTPAAIRFVSIEPMIDKFFLPRAWLPGLPITHEEALERGALRQQTLDWVIVGGESGPRARPCNVAWIRGIVEQCRRHGVPVFVKQLGSNATDDGTRVRTKHPKGGDPDEWPEDLRVRQWPKGVFDVEG